MSLIRFDMPTFSQMAHVARNMRELDKREIFGLQGVGDPLMLAHFALHADFKYVGLYDKEPVVAFGAQQMWPGVWTIFMFATDDFQKVGKHAMRFMKKHLVPDVMACGAHRAQCYSAAYHTEAHEFLVRMGAKVESRLEKFGKDGSDYYLFVWLDENKILNHRSLEA